MNEHQQLQAEKDARVAARAWDRAIRGRGGYGSSRLAHETGRGLRTVHNLCDGTTIPDLVDLRRDLRMLQADRSGRDLRLLQDLFGDLGYEVRPAPALAPVESVADLTLQASAAVGAVSGEVATALADSRIDGDEGHRIDQRASVARRLLDYLSAALRHRDPSQTSLALEAP